MNSNLTRSVCLAAGFLSRAYLVYNTVVLIHDRDSIFSSELDEELKSSFGLRVLRTSVRAPKAKGYASYCTSCEPCTTFSGKRHRSESLIPWALRGGFGPGSSYSHSFLSLTG